jgi:hypothetical protein
MPAKLYLTDGRSGGVKKSAPLRSSLHDIARKRRQNACRRPLGEAKFDTMLGIHPREGNAEIPVRFGRFQQGEEFAGSSSSLAMVGLAA